MRLLYRIFCRIEPYSTFHFIDVDNYRCILNVDAEQNSKVLMLKFMKAVFSSSVIRFLFVGMLNTLFGYSLYALLIFSGVNYFYSLMLTTIIGVIFNFCSIGKMVFQGVGGRITFIKFICVYFVVFVFNAYSLDYLVAETSLNPYISQGICLVPSVCFNWLMLKNWVFK